MRPVTMLLAASLVAPAAAQMRAGPTGAVRWTPPFAAASPAVLGGLQSLLATPAGARLAADLPSVGALRSLSQASEADLRVVGALGAHLPADFPARLAAAKDAAAQAEMTRQFEVAYRAAAPEVARAVESRANQVAVAVAYGQMDGRDIVVAAEQLERFGLYGPAVQDKARIVRRLASQNLMENAQRIAADFLRTQRPAEAAGPEGGPRKAVPEDWRLRAYRKAAEAGGEAAPRPAPPAPSEPKANPMAGDLYQRLGARKGMVPAELEAAYRKAEALHRPERYLDRDARSLIVLTLAHRRIEDAWAVLSDRAKRADYDAGRAIPEPPSPNPLSDDYYERIGATRGMSEGQLKSAYRRAAALYHPDKFQAKGEALGKAMTSAFQGIQEAWGTLEDPAKRAAYDRRPAKAPHRR